MFCTMLLHSDGLVWRRFRASRNRGVLFAF
jgi:hypothetical protein